MSSSNKSYYSCDSICNNIHFAFDKIYTCCSSFVGNFEWPLLAKDYKGGLLPIQKIISAKEKLIEDNNKPSVQNSCKQCNLLQHKQWKSKNSQYIFNDVVLNHFSMCNLSCQYCYTTSVEPFMNHQLYLYEAYPILKEMIDNQYIGRGCTVYWAGGEPAILPELGKCSELLIDNNIFQAIYSNGVLFSDVIESALKRKMMSLTTSLDAGSRELYSKIHGNDYFERVWGNLERYVEAGEVYAKYIMMEENSDQEEIDLFVLRCKTSGIEHIRLDIDERLLSSGSVPEKVLRAAAYLIFIARKANYWIGLGGGLENIFGNHSQKVKNYLAELGFVIA
jgi:sulfatase maturation enzyme AslB (radical SAM superfamily)